MSVSKRLKRYRGWIAVVVLVAVAGTAYAVTKSQSKAATGPTYTTEAAAKGTLSATVSGTGNLQARDTVNVSPAAGGTVASVAVAEGDKVKKGDVLYKLDRNTAEQNTARALASKRQADQAVAQAKLQLLQAQTDYANLKTRSALPTSNVTSTDLKIAAMKVSSAKLGLTSATASAQSVGLTYDDALTAEKDLTITSPCDGVVWAVNIAEGDAVAASSGSSAANSANSSGASAQSASTGSSAPVQIARNGELALKLAVNETDEPNLKPGQDADLTFDAVPALSLTGKVDSIGTKGTVSSGVVTYDVWVVLDVQDPHLKSGMSSSATIVTSVARNVLLVPNSAIKTNTDGTKYVQVMDSGATQPKNVTVTTGLAGTSQTVITGGITEGTNVVTKTTTASTTSTSGTTTKSSSSKTGGGFFMGGGPGGGPGGN